MGSSQGKVRSMRMLLDTNVLLDVALERSPFFADSDRILALVEQKQITGYICASSISDIFYILRKSKGRQLAIDFLGVITSICLVATVNDEVIRKALASDFKDFEDAIQYQTAVNARLDGIITRNSNDYKNSSIAVFTPAEFLQSLE